MLVSNPRHPSLHFKKVGGYWSVRVGLHYRALGTEVEDGVPALAPWLTKQFSVEAFSARHLNLVGKRPDDLSRSPGGECSCTNEGF